MNAREHAETAARLLDRLAELQTELAEMDPMRRLELNATGGARALNESMDWTLHSAIGHALVASALRATEVDE